MVVTTPAATPQPIRLLLVDDHDLIRMGLRTLFAGEPEFLVVGEAGCAEDALEQARGCQPDVIIMDVRLPDASGVDVCREIRSERPETRVLMFTGYPDEEAVLASIMAGAAGYMLKEANPRQLVEAVKIVARGASLLDPRVTSTVLAEMRRLGEHPADPLSDQEQRVLSLIEEGKTNREIAEALYLSEHTVKTHVSHILHKLSLKRRAEAAALSARRRHHTSPHVFPTLRPTGVKSEE